MGRFFLKKKKKHPKSRAHMRRSHHALKPKNSIECANCGEPKLPHHVCAACGHYDGRSVNQVEDRVSFPRLFREPTP